jgi:FMN phosphatase YigB (HAD superfamily)
LAKIRAFLLDLDDTLLVNDMETFSPHYFRALLNRMRGVCPAGAFVEALNAGIRAMWHNDGRQATNADVFAREFYRRLDRDPLEIEPILLDFYAREFDDLGQHTERDPMARELVQLLQERGYQIAIATQPLFPRVAIETRLRWAGVGPDEFHYDLITSYEIMKACKPRTAYFEDVLQKLGRSAPEAIMVGDSPESDMPARRMGLRTFWVDRGRLSNGVQVDCDAQGDLRDLYTLVETGALDEL